MRKRTCSMLIRLTPEEMAHIGQKAKAANVSREEFCRQVLCGIELKEAPPAEYYDLIMEVRRVGSNINQILKKANALGLVDVPLIRKALEDNHATEEMLWQTFRNGGSSKWQ